MATMMDVAKRAKVSLATVSFVLNKTKPISDETRRRVEQAIDELGFRRNALARGLASQQTRILALAMPIVNRSLGGTVLEIGLAAAAAAQLRDYHVVLWPVNHDGSDLEDLIGHNLVDGVLLMEVVLEDSRISTLQKNNITFSMIGRNADPVGLSYVDVDFDSTIDTAVRYLQSLGHRNIGLVTSPLLLPGFSNYGPVARSRAAYSRLCREARPARTPLRMPAGARGGAGIRAPTCRRGSASHRADDPQRARGLRRGLGAAAPRRQGPGADLINVADHFAADGALTDPTLTIMRSPVAEMGKLCVDMLIGQLEGSEAPAGTLLPCTLFVGESTSVAAWADRPAAKRLLS